MINEKWDTECGIPDVGYRMWDTGCGMPDAGYWKWDTGYGWLDTGCWWLVAEDAGSRLL